MIPALPSLRPVLSIVLSALLVVPLGAQESDAPKALNIVIVEGDGAINNVRQRISREPIIQVTDENNRPVAGAAVTFFLPGSGPGAAFPNGATSLTTVTDAQGKAIASGLKANTVKGQFQVRVSVSYKGKMATKSFLMTNAAGAAIGTATLWTLLLIAGAGAAAGVAVALNGGGGGTPTPTKPPVTITPGTPVVTPPR